MIKPITITDNRLKSTVITKKQTNPVNIVMPKYQDIDINYKPTNISFKGDKGYKTFKYRNKNLISDGKSAAKQDFYNFALKQMKSKTDYSDYKLIKKFFIENEELKFKDLYKIRDTIASTSIVEDLLDSESRTAKMYDFLMTEIDNTKQYKQKYNVFLADKNAAENKYASLKDEKDLGKLFKVIDKNSAGECYFFNKTLQRHAENKLRSAKGNRILAKFDDVQADPEFLFRIYEHLKLFKELGSPEEISPMNNYNGSDKFIAGSYINNYKQILIEDYLFTDEYKEVFFEKKKNPKYQKELENYKTPMDFAFGVFLHEYSHFLDFNRADRENKDFLYLLNDEEHIAYQFMQGIYNKSYDDLKKINKSIPRRSRIDITSEEEKINVYKMSALSKNWSTVKNALIHPDSHKIKEHFGAKTFDNIIKKVDTAVMKLTEATKLLKSETGMEYPLKNNKEAIAVCSEKELQGVPLSKELRCLLSKLGKHPAPNMSYYPEDKPKAKK